jgi:hypothetical protein
MTDGRGQPELSDQQDLGRLLAQIPGWRLLALCRVTRAELSQGSKQSGPNWSIRRSPNITDRLSGRRDGMLVVAAVWKAQPSHKPPATLSEPSGYPDNGRDRGGEHPRRHVSGWAGILQADAYAGFGKLYEPRAKSPADRGSGVLGPRPTPVRGPLPGFCRT